MGPPAAEFQVPDASRGAERMRARRRRFRSASERITWPRRCESAQRSATQRRKPRGTFSSKPPRCSSPRSSSSRTIPWCARLADSQRPDPVPEDPRPPVVPFPPAEFPSIARKISISGRFSARRVGRSRSRLVGGSRLEPVPREPPTPALPSPAARALPFIPSVPSVSSAPPRSTPRERRP